MGCQTFTYPEKEKGRVFQNMYLNSHEESECCGCSACEQICPRHCINMTENKEGFLYPKVDRSNCIKCGLCKKVCPIENAQEQNQRDICYYGWHKDEHIRLMSTSGAAFIAIAQVCKSWGYRHFYGAAYDEQLQVHHVDNFDFMNPALLRCSKYTQSRMENVYSEIRNYLKNGEKVLFSGTPCQVDGLKKYLGKLSERNLFLVALVCHGVSSPKALSTYLHEVEKNNGTLVKSIKFRDKKMEDGILTHRFTTLKLENGKEITSTSDIYTTTFGIGVMDRESCYKCPYASPSGAGDITIGDFWGIEKKIPEIKNQISKGISLLIPHTNSGERMASEVKKYMELERVPISYALNDRQRQLLRPIERPTRRNVFLKRVLTENKSFHKEAKVAICVWKIDGYKKRIVKKIRSIAGMEKEKQ